MPIKPPNLDDRRYADIVEEARGLIPQYTPEWTNQGDADPGMTLLQLFAWMTELIIYRLNKVPDKTYVHFLNFIGEERRRARPSVGPVTFSMKGSGKVELPAFSQLSTRQREDKPALDFLTVDNLTVHGSQIIRVMAVKGGAVPSVREVPFSHLRDHPSALEFSHGRGVQFFDLDPADYGPDAYTPHQFFYVAHDDFRLMDIEPEEGRRLGRLRMRRSSGDDLPVASFFQWEYPTEQGWMPVQTQVEEDEVLGMPEVSLVTAMPGITSMELSVGGVVPEPVSKSTWWIRGRLDYERWLAERMHHDLEVSWQDDRGGEERALHNWEVHASGRALEFFLQDLPPIRGGWTIRMALVDRGVRAGKNSYLPRYRWYYRRGEAWEVIPKERVRIDGTMVVIMGPLADMAGDGYNIRAERVETVFLRGFVPDLEVDMIWIRPVEVSLAAGDDPRRSEVVQLDESPWDPFQINPQIPPTIGRKFWIGSDLFDNRPKTPVLLELEVGFEINGELIEEPADKYLLQLTYRAEDNWRVVWDEEKIFAGFTFATLDDEGAKMASRRRIRIVLDPKQQLKGLARHKIGDVETTWIRLELVKSNLSSTDKKTKEQSPIALRIYDIRLGADKTLGDDTYREPLPGPKMAQLDHREQNRRLTRVVTRATGRLAEFYPYFPFVDIDEVNQALYVQFDKPLPEGARHTMHFRCRGEAFMPEGVGMEWEVLEQRAKNRVGWRRLPAASSTDNGQARAPYDMAGSGVLEFSMQEVPQLPPDGFWMRGRFKVPEGTGLDAIPALPPVAHLLLNTVDAVNLHTRRTERYSGHAVPNQSLQLLRKPVFVHEGEGERAIFPRPDMFEDLKVFVERDDGTREEWKAAPEGNLLTADKDDRVFFVDPVEGTLNFGNGIRGRMLPAGSNNVLVDTYRVVPGAKGNVGPGEIVVGDGLGEGLKCINLLPAVGGRDAETIDEIIRRAPSILTSRDRAVTRADFEVIAQESSAEVARAACTGAVEAEDGKIGVIVLPRRREGELVPDAFMSEGLRDHVSRYVKRRCLVNVDPIVRLARFMPVDVSVTLRLRPNANVLQVREAAEQWVMRFLDPYHGGLDGEGWPFGGTLYSQDFARMVSDLGEIRHVVEVRLFDMSGESKVNAPAGWEEGEGDDELFLTDYDLFVVRRVRVRSEEGGE